MPFFSRCSRRTPDNLSLLRVCIAVLLTDALCEIIKNVHRFCVEQIQYILWFFLFLHFFNSVWQRWCNECGILSEVDGLRKAEAIGRFSVMIFDIQVWLHHTHFT